MAAKRNLELPRALRKLDQFAVLILDDVGYIQQSPEEAEILFTLLAERYERRSVFITSNLIFAHWDRIFRDQMATAAAINRLVPHSVLLEFDVPSFRTEHATRRSKGTTRPGARSTLGYQSRLVVRDAPVVAAMRDLSAQYPRYGYRRIRIFLKRAGPARCRRPPPITSGRTTSSSTRVPMGRR